MLKADFESLRATQVKNLLAPELWQEQKALMETAQQLQAHIGTAQHHDFNAFDKLFNKAAKQLALKLAARDKKQIIDAITWTNPDAELYLLRNVAGKGAVGVFIDGGFEPDFILWIKHQDEQGKEQQQVVFIDPKGLRHHTYNDPKVNFYRSIKALERNLHANNPSMQHIKLHSFLVSQTHAAELESR